MLASRVMLNRLPIVLCLGALPLLGCGNQLTTPQAEQVIATALAQRRASGMPNPTEGRIDLQVGALRGSSAADQCAASINQPLELADLELYDRAQIVHLERPEPCKWVVTLSPQAERDVAYDDTFKPPTPRDYNAVSIALSQWESLEVSKIQQQGMRNSNCLAIAPTATISNIIGVSACIEPQFQNLYVKSNLAGEFTVINEYLIADLKKLGIWDEVMIADLKYFDGSVQKIDRIPDDLKTLYATAFEVDATWLVEGASRRQKWIDQGQSLNVYVAGASGKKLDEVYKLAWLRGLKTTYYLRTQAATSVEKSTVAAGKLNAVLLAAPVTSVPEALAPTAAQAEQEGPACYLRPGDSGYNECEACQ